MAGTIIFKNSYEKKPINGQIYKKIFFKKTLCKKHKNIVPIYEMRFLL